MTAGRQETIHINSIQLCLHFIVQLTRNLFDKSMLWMAAIELCDRSSSHKVSAARFVSDITGILANELYDKSNLRPNYKKWMNWISTEWIIRSQLSYDSIPWFVNSPSGKALKLLCDSPTTRSSNSGLNISCGNSCNWFCDKYRTWKKSESIPVLTASIGRSQKT